MGEKNKTKKCHKEVSKKTTFSYSANKPKNDIYA